METIMKFDKCTGSEFSFTGKVLTLADLEQAAIRETKAPLSDAARESWNYFGFDRKNDWKAVITCSDAILVTDENRDLNWGCVHPDTESFILWLEETHEERENEKERQFQEQKQAQIEPATSITANESTVE